MRIVGSFLLLFVDLVLDIMGLSSFFQCLFYNKLAKAMMYLGNAEVEFFREKASAAIIF